MSVHVQTGNMLDVVIEGKSIGLKQRDSDHRKYEVIWLPDPQALVDVLAAEIKRLKPATSVSTEVGGEVVTQIGNKCVSCLHELLANVPLSDLGECRVLIVGMYEDSRECGCKCIFPPTESVTQDSSK